jgi:YD repeat-containing protein
LRHIGAANQTTIFGYEKNDNLKTVTDPRAGVYGYTYDSLNRLIRETDQENAQVNTTLDGQGQVSTYADPRNLQTVYSRNGFGEVKRRVSPDSGNTDTVYDARGLATQITDGRGIVTSMTYDAAGRILTKTYPAAVAENVTYTYDDVTAGNKGKGRLTRIASQNVTIDRTYDQRGNITTDTRTISGFVHTTAYLYNAADRVTQITYPSGRIVNYVRDTTGRITSATTKQNAAAAVVTLASGIIRQPHTNVVQSLVYGNGLNDWNTFTNDTEQDLLQVYDGATPIINRSHTRTDNLNLTNVWDTVTAANNQSYWHNASNKLQNGSLFRADSRRRCAPTIGAAVPGAPRRSMQLVLGLDPRNGVGNRTQEISTVSAVTTTRVLG